MHSAGIIGLPISAPRMLLRCSRLTRNAVSTSFARRSSSLSKERIAEALSKPTWSLKSLLPPTGSLSDSPEVTPELLRHLLRLSALPQPQSSKEESEMLGILSSQIHFVKEVQAVDTTGVVPLRALRDETSVGVERSTIGLEQMKPYLAEEEVVGRNGRIRRKKATEVSESYNEIGTWDPLESAQEKRGRYFVVTRKKQVTANQRDQDAPS